MQLTSLRIQDPATKTYLGSPSLVRLQNGELLATHDYFGTGCPRNHENEEHLSSVYRSCDDGRSWQNVTHISGAYWSTLFVQNGAIYLLGTSQQYGSIVIRRSDDGGNTWTHPADEQHGLLFRGGPYRNAPNYHCAPTPVVIYHERIYKAFEDCTPFQWGVGFQSFVISAALGDDLLNATNWRMSNKTRFDRGWVPDEWGQLTRAGVLEGNIVIAPSGELWNVLRLHSSPVPNKAIVLRVEDDGLTQRFVQWVEMPGGFCKFTIRRDPHTQQYVMLGNTVPDLPEVNQFIKEYDLCPRNRLSLYASADLLTWRHCMTLLADDLGLTEAESLRRTGFQYADWFFDGDDLSALVRTAYNGAPNPHDSNMITFHKIRNFRQLISA